MKTIQIISHRGYWQRDNEKNTMIAFSRSLINNYGIETDLRDKNGEIIISHDIQIGTDVLYLKEFLKLYKNSKKNLPLLLNIKSDGIIKIIKNNLNSFGVSNYYLFDMSIPETKKYAEDSCINFITRISDIEKYPLFINESKGFWIDSFYGNYPEFDYLDTFLNSKYIFCFVSPELHNRSEIEFWEMLKKWIQARKVSSDKVLLCTDRPKEAFLFFNHE
tara:strand:+ start:44 stop:700 length:657 start_codon:yes stop_codon:yes gene_type:complete